MLAACGTNRPASVLGGECKIFERPQYAVKGKRAYDQNWIDSQVEGGVGGCGWKRPSSRPASLDVPAQNPPAARGPEKKSGLIKRIKDRFVAPAAPIEPTPFLMQSITVHPAPPKPRNPVDELLGIK